MKNLVTSLMISCLVSTAAIYGDFNDVSAQIIHGDTKHALEGLKEMHDVTVAADPSMAGSNLFDLHAKQKPHHDFYKPYLGWTLLMIAAAKGNIEVVKALVNEYGATPTVTNDQNETALDIARRSGQREVVQFLESKK